MVLSVGCLGVSRLKKLFKSEPGLVGITYTRARPPHSRGAQAAAAARGTKGRVQTKT